MKSAVMCHIAKGLGMTSVLFLQMLHELDATNFSNLYVARKSTVPISSYVYVT